MIGMRYKYPGDPVSDAVKMDRAEFFGLFPPETRTIEVITENEHEVSNVGTKIMCDFCSEDPEDEIYLIDRGSKALCKKCADQYILPYLTNRN